MAPRFLVCETTIRIVRCTVRNGNSSARTPRSPVNLGLQNVVEVLVVLARLVGTMALLLLFSASWIPSVNAQSSTALTVHARVCPTDQIPVDFFATCHDDPIADLEFFADDVSAGTTGSDGNLAIDVAGDSVALSGGVPGEFARNFIYCSDNADQSIEVEFAEVAAGTSVTVPVGSAGTTCDWYVVPFDLSGNEPTPTPDDDDEVTQLPNTGSGYMEGVATEGMLAVAGMLAATVMMAAVALRRKGN